MIKLVLTDQGKDKKVIDPATMKKVSSNGVLVRKISSYWRNRIKDKDVEVEKQKKSKGN